MFIAGAPLAALRRDRRGDRRRQGRGRREGRHRHRRHAAEATGRPRPVERAIVRRLIGHPPQAGWPISLADSCPSLESSSSSKTRPFPGCARTAVAVDGASGRSSRPAPAAARRRLAHGPRTASSSSTRRSWRPSTASWWRPGQANAALQIIDWTGPAKWTPRRRRRLDPALMLRALSAASAMGLPPGVACAPVVLRSSAAPWRGRAARRPPCSSSCAAACDPSPCWPAAGAGGPCRRWPPGSRA